MSDPFHNTKAWRDLAKRFKYPRCVDCDSKEDIQAGHILPASRFKLVRLWKSNLVTQCGACNAKLGADIRWSWQAIKLLGIYYMIKTFLCIIQILLLAVLAKYIYWDISHNDSIITDQIRVDAAEYYQPIEDKAIELYQLIKDLR